MTMRLALVLLASCGSSFTAGSADVDAALRADVVSQLDADPAEVLVDSGLDVALVPPDVCVDSGEIPRDASSIPDVADEPVCPNVPTSQPCGAGVVIPGDQVCACSPSQGCRVEGLQSPCSCWDCACVLAQPVCPSTGATCRDTGSQPLVECP
jgi:hypothetical protein